MRIAIERANARQALITVGLSKNLKSQSEKMKARRRDFGLSRAAGQCEEGYLVKSLRN
jgi:hypothetical protein